MEQKKARELARKDLLNLKKALDKADISFFLMFGTLLGAVRDKDLISYDKDIDLGILYEDSAKLEKAEKIISDAEAEAERLIEEARKAGDELVKEADVQGEKLIKEAGSNPLKQIAAKKGAEELKRQAEKQSANLVREAEVKANEIIEKARSEADRI